MQTKSALLKQLAETMRQIEHGENIIGAQRRILVTATGRDATEVKQRMDSIELSQGMRLSHLDSLLDALDTMPVIKHAA